MRDHSRHGGVTPDRATPRESPRLSPLARKRAAQELIDELLELDTPTREGLKAGLDDIAAKTARSDLAVLRIKNAVHKLSPAAAQAFKKAMGALAAEGVKALMHSAG